MSTSHHPGLQMLINNREKLKHKKMLHYFAGSRRMKTMSALLLAAGMIFYKKKPAQLVEESQFSERSGIL